MRAVECHDNVRERFRAENGPPSFAFLAVVPVVLVLGAIGAFILPRLIDDPRPAHSGLKFFIGVGLAPEPLEQARFLLFLLSGPAVLAASVLLARALRGISPSTAALDRCSLAVQVAAAAAIVFWWWSQQRQHPYFSTWTIGIAVVAGALLVRLLFSSGPPAYLRRWAVRREVAVLAVLIAFAATMIALLPALYTDGNVSESLPGVRLNIPFTMDEFAAVANGRTPLVDFIPQYSNVLPYFLAPILSIVGFSVTTFSAAMYVMSAIAFLSIFYVFYRITGRWAIGLLLYLPFLSFSLYRTISRGPQHIFIANYFAAMPLRYFGPWVVAALVVWQIRGSSLQRLIVLFGVAGLLMLNNPDFGFFSLGAAVVAVWLAEGPQTMRSAIGTCRVLAAAAAGVVSAVAGLVAFTLLRSGELPDLGLSLYYARQFALSGLFMLPMPPSGLHLVIGLTLVGALVRAVFRGASELQQSERARLLTAMLAYGSVFGLGAAAYFVGRSHRDVLVALFSSWALVLVLLLWDASVSIRRTSGNTSTERALWVLPTLLVAIHLGLALAPGWQMRDVTQQASRIFGSAGEGQPDELATFIRDRAAPGEEVLIMAPLSHLSALRAGVRDLFPYNTVQSVVTYEQLEFVRDRLRLEKVRRVFAGIPLGPEVHELLVTEGFRASSGDHDRGQPVLWERPTHYVLPGAATDGG